MMAASHFVQAQNKAQIQIRKNQNGVLSEEKREIELEEGQNIEDVLRQMGILDEFGQLKPGQELQIRIDKSGDLEDFEDFELMLTPPDAPDAWNLPEFAPMPPMENRPFLGVMLKQNEEGKKGVLVTETVAGSSAESAGILAGDILLSIDKQDVNSVNDVITYIQSKKAGDDVALQIERDGKKKKIKAVLGEKAMEMPMMRMAPGMPAPPNGMYQLFFGPDSITIYCPPAPNCICPNDSMKICQPFSWNGPGFDIRETAFLGVTPAEEESEAGVRINVEPETAAEKMGLLDGDVLIEINSQSVKSFDQVSEIISQMKPGEQVSILIERDGRRKEITGELGKRSMSGFDDFRIFHDFKGMDEGGNYRYDYEFDMDAEDIEMRMQQMLEDIARRQGMLDEERSRVEEELNRLRENTNITEIRISISEITQEEAAGVNKTANPKLEITNSLPLDQISFFPNPGNGILNLNFETPVKKPVKIVIYNSNGELIYLEERSNFEGRYSNTIDISMEPVGTYFLQIMQEGKTYSKKIVKGS